MSSNTIKFPTEPLPDGYMTADTGHTLIAVGISFIVLEIFAFGLRIMARRMRRVPFGLDDGFLIPALIFNLLVCALAITAVPYAGAGRHTLSVMKEDPKKIEYLGINALMAMPISYMLAVAFSKAAILSIYVRIFRLGFVIKMTYAVAVVVTVHTIVTIFVIIFQCKPISDLWAKIIRENCINTQQFFAYTSIPNIATDIFMLVMPLPEIWRLHTTTKIKLGVTITLLTASIGIISSIIRFAGFFTSDIFTDPTWESTPLMSYSVVEPGTYFLAACLPSYRPLIRYLNTNVVSFISKKMGSHQQLGSSSGPGGDVMIGYQGQSDDIERDGSAKPVRGFDSVLLSEISADTSTRSTRY